MINGKKIAVVLPAYNAAKTLAATVCELPETVDIRILVDDSSGDETVALAGQLGLSKLLAAEEINFIDLTGNALVKLEDPALYLRSTGAPRNPEPAPRGRAQVRGPKAARLVRLLADVTPPYSVGEIARAAGLTAGYVSRLLDTLDREALIERSRRGRVESVDLPGLLRRWAESYDVLSTSGSSSFVAPNGVNDVLGCIADIAPPGGLLAITGSFAAVKLAPVAAPTLLLAYCDDVPVMAEELRLLPADEGANVVLLAPFDPVVWERGTRDGNLSYAAPSQVAIDCLTGPGRMPAEGEAVLAWMQEDESRWRLLTDTENGDGGVVLGGDVGVGYD